MAYWQVFPLGFTGAPESGILSAAQAKAQLEIHRLRGLIPWLDHVVAMGCDGLLLGPVFAAQSHGYDTADYFRIDPRLGDEADFEALIEAAHAQGLSVILDGVFNHTGRAFVPFQDLVANGERSEYADWFLPTFADDGTLKWVECFEGNEPLVVLNKDLVAVQDFVGEVMRYWLGRGADGWRLDAAYTVPAEFWAKVLPGVREAFPAAWILGEMIHGDYAEYVARSGVDSVTQYELWKAIWSAINEKNFFELSWALGRHNSMLETFSPQTFLSNHDVTRIASAITDTRHIEHAVVLLLTLGGVPSIYAGDEWGLTGVKEERPGGDAAVRPKFPALPPGSAELDDAQARIEFLYRSLLALRAQNPCMERAASTEIELTNQTYFYRVGDGEDSLRVALNLSDQWQELPGPTQVVAGHAEISDAGLSVPPHGWVVAAWA
ncbi:MAG: DUF3459 domain-containing protein [Propionibacteriaceae bacterium]|jgi:cyclomaltodextrinase|nr:DUF3459 domain-containing protein [Propionibacteriaceae bacterium]